MAEESTARNTETWVSVLFFKLMSDTELTLNRSKIKLGQWQSNRLKGGGGWGCKSGWSGLRDFSHLECLCFIECFYVCVDVNMGIRFRCPLRQRIRILWEAQGRGRLWPRGEDRAPGSFVLCSWFLSLVQLLARGQRSETLCQGALTRLDPRIELQRKQPQTGGMFNMTNVLLWTLVHWSLTSLCTHDSKCIHISNW